MYNRIHVMFVTSTEIKKIQLGARDHLKKIFSDHEKLKMQLESQKKEFESRGRELEKREAQNETESKYLAEEIEKVHFFPSFLSQDIIIALDS